MAFSWQEEVVPSGTTDISVDIEYLDKSYIFVYLNNVLTTAYTWVSASTIKLDIPVQGSTVVTLVRRTNKEYLYLKFAEGAAFIRENLDTQNTQFLHLAQEMVEGRSIDGFYGDISMNGYRITNLGAGTAPGDAVNKGQLDVVNDRVTGLEQSFNTDTHSYPGYVLTTEETDTITPGLSFTKASVYVNGLYQQPEYSFVVVDNSILLAEVVPAGTFISFRLGEDTEAGTDVATAAQLMQVKEALDALVAGLRTDVDANAASIAGLSSTLSNLSDTVSGISTSLGNTQAAVSNLQGDYVSKSAAVAQTLTTNLLAPVFDASTEVRVAGTKVLGSRRTGVTAGTGTESIGAFNADTALTVSAAYSQAEVTAIKNFVVAVAQRTLMLEKTLRLHGLLGT